MYVRLLIVTVFIVEIITLFTATSRDSARPKRIFSGHADPDLNFTNSWAVVTNADPLDIARSLGLTHKGQIGPLEGHHLMELLSPATDTEANQIESKMDQHYDVIGYIRQSVRRRAKRSLQFNDPYYALEWHIVSTLCRNVLCAKGEI